jgi:protein arginine kinase activator
MKCDDCDAPATVELDQAHLCQHCAQRRGTGAAKPAADNGLLSAARTIHQLATLVCPECGIRYMEFRKIGRLGCPHDYTVFRDGLLPLLDRVHSAVRHRGKRPAEGGQGAGPAEHQLRTLRRELRRAVESQDFAAAARLRDLIRAGGVKHGS